MKKRVFIAALLILILLCSACGAEKTPEAKSVSAQIGGHEMVVTFEPGNLSAGTIRADHGTYTFTWDRSGDLKITYPDGTRFTYTKSGSGLTSLDFDPEAKGYPDGITMAWGLESAIDEMRPARNSGGGSALLGLLLLAIGAVGTFAPRAAWYLSYGWRFRDAEPSDAALAVQVCGGVVALLAGGVCLLAAVL